MSTPSAPADLARLETPCLVLDTQRMTRNIERMRAKVHGLGARLRPHVKTSKCVEAARLATETPNGPITVSTLREAEQFFAAGMIDILYAVGIAPDKLDRVLELNRRGAHIAILLDSAEAAAAVNAKCAAVGEPLTAFIEIDSDGHRAGVKPDDPRLLPIARALVADGHARLGGVMTHAGGSYNCESIAAMRAMAEQERLAVVNAATRLRKAGLACPTVSVGSTPTATCAGSLEGVDEVRAGVFVFFDLVMAGIGVCTTDDIALSVLTAVIGHQHQKGWVMVDAGWMALSRDRGTAKQKVDQGYGLVCDLAGRLLPDLIVVDANQEHGVVAIRPGSTAHLPDLPLGARLRILPNHACATAAQHDRYWRVEGGETAVAGYWPRFSGW